LEASDDTVWEFSLVDGKRVRSWWGSSPGPESCESANVCSSEAVSEVMDSRRVRARGRGFLIGKDETAVVELGAAVKLARRAVAYASLVTGSAPRLFLVMAAAEELASSEADVEERARDCRGGLG